MGPSHQILHEGIVEPPTTHKHRGEEDQELLQISAGRKAEMLALSAAPSDQCCAPLQGNDGAKSETSSLDGHRDHIVDLLVITSFIFFVQEFWIKPKIMGGKSPKSGTNFNYCNLLKK